MFSRSRGTSKGIYMMPFWNFLCLKDTVCVMSKVNPVRKNMLVVSTLINEPPISNWVDVETLNISSTLLNFNFREVKRKTIFDVQKSFKHFRYESIHEWDRSCTLKIVAWISSVASKSIENVSHRCSKNCIGFCDREKLFVLWKIHVLVFSQSNYNTIMKLKTYHE